MRLAARLCPDPPGSYSAPRDPLVVINGEGMEGKGWKYGAEEGREVRDVKG